MVINPEQAVAREIVRRLEFPSAIDVEAFANGRVQMVEIKAGPEMGVIGQTLREISKKSPHILIGAILRGDQVIVPRGADEVHEGDRVYVIGSPSRLYRFCARIGMQVRRIKNVMIVGGGRIAYYLAKHLDDADIRAKIIEIDKARCVELSELLPDSLIINGDGTDDKLLYSENLAEMDSFIAVTGMDEENLMTGLLAKHAGVQSVVVKINRVGYTEVINGMGLDNLVRPKGITANYILRYVRGLKNVAGNTVNTLYQIVEGQLEAVEFTANRSTRYLDIPLKRLKIVPGALVAAIVRQNNVIIPHGNDDIRLGDKVVLISKGMALMDLNDAFASMDGHA